jgi:hypothetical protein
MHDHEQREELVPHGASRTFVLLYAWRISHASRTSSFWRQRSHSGIARNDVLTETKAVLAARIRKGTGLGGLAGSAHPAEHAESVDGLQVRTESRIIHSALRADERTLGIGRELRTPSVSIKRCMGYSGRSTEERA